MSKAIPRIVIIGGTSGIGLATATLLASRGAAVTIVGRNAAKLDKAVRALGASATGEVIDATDRKDCCENHLYR